MDFDKLSNEMKIQSPIPFEDFAQIPESSGIYAGWKDDESECFYVGKAGILQDRIRSHYSGQRGSDQFCLYVYDQYVHDDRPSGISTREVNRITRDWIRDHVKFTYLLIGGNQIDEFEILFRKKWKPILNPL